jgi:hypothetical protein
VNIKVTSATVISVIGDSFWTEGASPRARVGVTGCEASAWVSETSLACKGAVGTGGSVRVTLTLGRTTGSCSDTVSYDGVVVSAASVRNLMSTKHRSVTVDGAGLGLWSVSRGVRLGSTGCESSVWYSDTSLVSLTVAHQGGGTRRVSVTAGHRVGSQSEVFTVDGVGVSAGGRANIGGSGGVRVTVAGGGWRRYSMSEVARVGRTGCEGSRWISQTAVMCLASHSISGTRRVSVTSVIFVGSVTGMVSADVGVLSVLGASNVMLPGGEGMVVMGSGLGAYGHTAGGAVGQTSTESTGWISESSVMCKTPAGVLKTLRITLTLGAQVMSRSMAVSYESAVVSGAGRGDGEREDGEREVGEVEGAGGGGIEGGGLGEGVNIKVTSATVISVIGDSFWTEGASPRARVGVTGCEASAWVSETSLACKGAVGTGGSVRVTLTLGRTTGSCSDTVSYDGVVVSAASVRNLMSTKHRSVTVDGAGLGLWSVSRGVRLGSTGCESSVWYSDTSLVSLTVAYQGGGTRRVSVTAGQRIGSQSEVFTVDGVGMSAGGGPT